MNDTAYELLFERLSADGGPDEKVVDLVLAAADGDEQLNALLAGQPAAARRAPAASDSKAQPARVYLEQIVVKNFRGIAEPAKLPLEPGPGLTLVVGRNGSGKSSFAEGLELLLTGTNLRWEDRTKVWKDGWRNLHGSGATVLGARFRVDGESEPLELQRRWSADASLEGGEPIAVNGARDSWDSLAWDGPLMRYRPLLSYNELGTMFSSRAAALYEALSAVLGLEDFDAVTARLRGARLALGKTEKTEKADRAALRARLGDVEDIRASTIAEQLAKRTPDLDAVEQLVTEESGPEVNTAALRALAAIEVPAAASIRERVGLLVTATTEVAALESTDAERRDALARLLTDALAFHERHGDAQTCPVCGTNDVIDPGWSLRTQVEVQELQRLSQDLRTARATETQRRRDLDALFPSTLPGTLRAAGGTEDAELDPDNGLSAWDTWAELLRAEPERVASEGEAVAVQLAALVMPLRDTAEATLEARKDAWRPVQADVLAWLALARRTIRDKESIVAIKSAEEWMAGLTADLRRERLGPIVGAAQANWSELRHESNVALGNVELRKQGTQRFAAFDVTVDGTESSAFGVMSQGELSALAISIFLPRASLPESPFGFMVIDDPVQSMDPAKVDGLARVLAGAADGRQVVVFTHDERLPEAVRRLAIDARIIHVKRRAASKVELVLGRPPSDRYIGEAYTLAKTTDLPDEVRARVVPGFCRSAVEAACAARIRRRLIGAGTPHADVEQTLAEPRTLTAWLADTFELSIAQGADISDRVRRIAGDDAVSALKTMRKGAHGAVNADAVELVRSTKRLVTALEAE
jgi:ABC-type lipoprotein export system ATPase subunit